MGLLGGPVSTVCHVPVLDPAERRGQVGRGVGHDGMRAVTAPPPPPPPPPPRRGWARRTRRNSRIGLPTNSAARVTVSCGAISATAASARSQAARTPRSASAAPAVVRSHPRAPVRDFNGIMRDFKGRACRTLGRQAREMSGTFEGDARQTITAGEGPVAAKARSKERPEAASGRPAGPSRGAAVVTKSKELGRKGGAKIRDVYVGSRKFVSQEDAWAETEKAVQALVEVVSSQHAMILNLLDRVARLEEVTSVHPVEPS